MSDSIVKTLPPRKDVTAGDTWDLASLFGSDAEWEVALAAWEARLPGFAGFAGTLGSAPRRLADCLAFDLDIDRQGDRVGTYAFLRAAEDQGAADAQRMVGRFQHVATRAGEAASFIRPEILAIPPDTLLAWRELPELAAYRLVLERLDFFEFNRDLYPRFDASTKMAARDEVFATFQHLLANDGSLRNLLEADYVVINSVLARYYGIDGVEGDHFRPVKLPAGSPRGGLLGMAAILAMGSNGDSTSPVERGAWVLRKLLDDAPPPAPANVPQIARLAGKTLTTRERLALHQDAPQCASCHRKIDPIGFGLENFDAVGQWRTEDSYQARNAEGKPDPTQKKLTWRVDPAGAFYGGPSFTDFFELRHIIARHDRDFARGLAKALVEYAIGRPCGFSDEPLVASLVEQSATHELGFRTLIHALVASEAFHAK
jgi:hypothetical protein